MRYLKQNKQLVKIKDDHILHHNPVPKLFRFDFRFPCCDRHTYRNLSLRFIAPFTVPPTVVPIQCHQCDLNFNVTLSVTPNKAPREPGRKGPRTKAIVEYEFNYAPVVKAKHISEVPLYPKLCTHRCKNYKHCKKCKKCRCFQLACGAIT